MTKETNQTSQTATGQTAQPAQSVQATDATQATQATQPATQVTAPTTDTKPADSTQDTTASTPVASTAPTVPDTVKLELSADQAEMVQDLLSNFVYAYQSDREVDCKRVLVPREKVGNYPYVAEAPDPAIIDPAYDWISNKWYSKTSATDLSEIAQNVKSLQSDQEAVTTQDLTLTKAVKQLGEGQANQNKLLASIQSLMLTIASSQKTTESTASTKSTQAATEPTASTKSTQATTEPTTDK